MPYSVPSPAPAPLPIHSHGHPGHRRSYSDERGPGAFAPLGLLPRRTRPAPPRTGPIKFHFRNDESGHDDDDDDDEDGSSSSSHDDISNITPALKIKPNNSFKLSLNTEGISPPPPSFLKRVPFPRSSPRTSPSPSPLPSPVYPPRPSVSRTSSTPILLSNGKPLKSSLKSSLSSPHIPLPDSQKTSHLRARSAPSTPHIDSPSRPSSPITPKNVHFASKEDGGLETVRLFSRSARPASVSRTSAAPHHHLSHPSLLPPPHAHIHLESLTFSSTPPALIGALLVRNLAYEKQVAVRFTLDDWQTTSEVAATHAASLPGLPPTFPLPAAAAPSTTLGDLAAGSVGWDRFVFRIRLEDYATRLDERTLWLVARYRPGRDGAEWWDNNTGANYRVGFRVGGPTLPASPSTSPPLSSSPPLSTPPAQRSIAPRSYSTSSITFPSFSPATLAPAHTTSASPPSTPSPHSPSSSSPTSTPTSTALPTPTESPVHTLHTAAYTAAAAHSTISRLKKLNLKNYAAPAPPAHILPPTSTAGPAASAQAGVRWPWGAATGPGSSPAKEVESIRMGGTAVTAEGGVDPESVVYEAFVRKWCFAGGVGV
ncbi:putative phosphatase regulatory subunit-domain-containing protein [Infundibulicybe gibba]|nr:putative phosphatase regulatory subunit-domain-containing protein [Infundibulicybe gibba]